jgi:hypothetical protein
LRPGRADRAPILAVGSIDTNGFVAFFTGPVYGLW